MSEFLLFVVLGAGSGGLYALASLGMVLVYRGSGVINFASGAMGMVGAFVFYQTYDEWNWPAYAAVILGVGTAAALAWFVHLLMLPLKQASNLTRVVVTLAALVVMTGAVSLVYPAANAYTVGSLIPVNAVSIAGMGVGENQFTLIAIGIVLTIVAGVVYRFTRFGLATSAVSENREAAASLGWSPNAIAGANWALGGALAGIAAILLAPVTGLSVGLGTSLLLPALAAAVLGNLSSFPLALGGGLLVGILQTVMNRYSFTGSGDAVPFAAILLFIILRGRTLPVRSFVTERLPRVTTGQINWRKALPAFVVVVVVVGFVLPSAWQGAVTYSATGAIMLASIVVVTGFAGQISLAEWAVAGCGALVMSQLVVAGVPFWAAIIVGVLAALPIGFVIGLSALRARGMSLAIATLSFSVCVISLVLSNNSLNGGASGLQIGNFNLFGFDVSAIDHPGRYAVFCIVLFVLVALMVANLRRGRAGRRLLAVRANERGAAAVGVNVLGAKLAAFCYAAMIAALGGILTILQFPDVLFSNFDTMTSITLVSNAVIGGIGFALGPIVGSIGQTGGIGNQILNTIDSNDVQYLTLIFGVLTLLVIVRAPDGLVPLQARDFNRLGRRVFRLGPPRRPVVELDDLGANGGLDSGRGEALLEVRELSVRFGGVTALDAVGFSLRSGEVLGVIGPNGAGKTTLVDAVTGFTASQSGTVTLDGDDLTKLTPRRRARRGLGRAFQSLELFEDMTVLENVLVACDRGDLLAWLSDPVHPGKAPLSPMAASAIRSFEFEEVLHEFPGELSYGKRRLLAIVRAIAANPRVLLLDEPAAGLDERERQELGQVIVRLAREWHMAVLLIEHDVNLVASVADRMVALDFGQVVATGTPDQVREDPSVRRSYLGIAEDAAPAAGGR